MERNYCHSVDDRAYLTIKQTLLRLTGTINYDLDDQVWAVIRELGRAGYEVTKRVKETPPC